MKRGQTYAWILILAWIVPALACNLPGQDTGAVQTAAALTVQAALTSGAPSATPTQTLVPPTSAAPATAGVASATPPVGSTVVSSCDKAQFVSETVPDNTTFSGGDDFTKTWTLKNIGTCSWTPSYSLVFVSGDALAGPANVSLAANVNPGQNITVSVNLEAPDANGTYHGNWGLRNAAGVIFSSFWVQVKVASGGGGGPFAVIHVTYSYSTADYSNGAYQDCPTVTAHITTNGPGDVQYRWTRSDGANAPVESLHFNSAGAKDVVSYWLLPTAAGNATRWKGIYIEEPNHQDFGHLSFDATCSSP